MQILAQTVDKSNELSNEPSQGARHAIGRGWVNNAERTVRLDEIALACFEQESRWASRDVFRNSTSVRVLSSMAFEVERAAILISMSTCVANAMTDPKGPTVSITQLLQHYPRESAELMMASHHIRKFGLAEAIRRHLRLYQSRLESAKSASLALASQMNRCDATAEEKTKLARLWRATCSATGVLLTEIRRTLADDSGSQPMSTSLQILTLLERVSTGEYPCVRYDGVVVMPDWAERRSSTRFVVSIPAVLRFGGQRVETTIENMSADGLGLHGANGGVAAEPVILELAVGARLSGIIVWSNANRMGIKLTNAIHADAPTLNKLLRAEPTA
jgi:PilZ domain